MFMGLQMAREEREVKAAYERNKDMLDVLKKQMAAVEASKEEAKRLQEEEAELMVCKMSISSK